MKQLTIYLLCLSLIFLTACDDWDEDWEDDWDDNSVTQSQPAPQAPALALDSETNGAFQYIDCNHMAMPTGDYDIDCGYLTVPENRTISDSRLIQLAVAIVRNPTGSQNPPVIYLAGGPGSSAIHEFLDDPDEWNYDFLQTRDLILLDQRGTGFSWPSLHCPELAEGDFTTENPERDCHSRLLAEGIDLTAYNTAENGADVAALRLALGYDEWDLLGISYGTRLALVVMRDNPEGVRSVVLDSVFPPNANTPIDEAMNIWESLQTLFADCEAEAYCRENYPDLEAVFLETVADLNENPADDLTGDDFVFIIAEALNDTFSIPLLPVVIYDVYYGDYDALDEIDSGYFDYSLRPRYQANDDLSDSDGMYNSVICRDEYSFGTYEAAEAHIVGSVPEEIEAAILQGVFELFQTCAYWGAGRAAAIEDTAVYSDIPTLILAGQYDHATPPKWAYLTAETLSRAYLFEFPGAGHALIMAGDCPLSLIDQFYDDPWSAPDGSCLADTEWPYFE